MKVMKDIFLMFNAPRLTFFTRKKIKKVEKLITNLHVKTEHVIQIRNLKQALNHGLVF